MREREEAVTGASVTVFRRLIFETQTHSSVGTRTVPGRIHIVDDDPSFRTAMERRLKQAGYNVATYTSAQQLLDRLPTGNEPSCIILDVQMPGLDGPALQKRLSELGSTLPIIFLTGHADTPTVVQTLKAGAQDFLTKPVASDDTACAVEKALADQRAWRDQQSASGRHSRPSR